MKTLAFRTLGLVGIPVAALAAVAGLAGCFDNDPGLQEKLIRSQVELQEQKQKLQDTEAALAKAESALKEAQAAPTPPPEATVPSKEQLNDGYISAAKEMRDQLKKELDGYTIVNCTLYEVNTVAAMPYTSKVAVALRSDKGQQYKLEMPVGADAAGKWKFPTTKEILDAVAKNPPVSSKNVASANPTPPLQGAPTPFQPRTQDRAPTPPLVTGMGDGNVDTIPLQWSNSQTRSGSGGGRQPNTQPVPPPNPVSGSTAPASRPIPQPVQPQPQPQPVQPSQPAPAMPADQSVLVTF